MPALVRCDEFEVMTVAGGEVAAGLGDADDRAARLQLFARHAVVHEALDIERGHVRVSGVVEPLLTAQG